MKPLQTGMLALGSLAIASIASAQTFSADSAAQTAAASSAGQAGSSGNPPAGNEPPKAANGSYIVPIELKPAVPIHAENVPAGPSVNIGLAPVGQ